MSTVEPPKSEQHFLITRADWDTYQSMLDMIGDRPIHITYDRGSLELMSPSGTHERFKKLIDRMLVVLAEELGLPIRSQGSSTFSSESLDRGLEPDECYYIQNEERVRGRDEIDLMVDPPPDLAVEIDITSSSLDRMEIYAALGVRELWRFDGQNLIVYQLDSDGQYAITQQSVAFPTIPIKQVSQHLVRRNKMDEIAWIREFRNWVRSLSSEQLK